MGLINPGITGPGSRQLWADTGGALHTVGPGLNNVVGNARGVGAVDLQVFRTLATQVASGAYSQIAGGSRNTASGSHSHAEGRNNVASGLNAHVEGSYNTSSHYGSHAEGFSCDATNYQCHAEGFNCVASGYSSHAEGRFTTSSHYGSHAEGENSVASGYGSHAEGGNSLASGISSHAESGSIASGNSSHAEGGGAGGGVYTTASGPQSHAEGRGTLSSNLASHSEGILTVASGYSAHAEGIDSAASLWAQHSTSGGKRVVTGDSQYSRLVVRGTTTNATQTELTFSDGGSSNPSALFRIVLPDNRTWHFNVRVAARRTDVLGDQAAFELNGTIKRDAGIATTAIIGSVAYNILTTTDSAWDVTVNAEAVTYGSLRVLVTGVAGKTIQWVATVKLVEVG